MGQSNSATLYRSLSKRRKEIRLLHLSPDFRETRSCTMETVSLLDDLEYAALSYIWGDPTHKMLIQINDETVEITENLFKALDHLTQISRMDTPGDQPIFHVSQGLWIDAVCINQADIKERNQQVALMASIYSSARLVYAWLGCDHIEGLSLVMDLFRLIASEVPNLNLRANDASLFEWLKKYPQFCAPEAGEHTRIDDDWFLILGAVCKFWTLPYWSRVWIVQECVLARRMYFLHSLQAIDMEMLFKARFWFHSMENVDEHLMRAHEGFLKQETNLLFRHGAVNWGKIDMLISLRPNYNSVRNAFDTVMHITERLEATRPEDYVYGLLGITGIDMMPDYRRPLADIYTEYITKWLRYRQKLAKNSEDDGEELRFLAAAGVGLYESSLGLSSRVPRHHQRQKTQAGSKLSLSGSLYYHGMDHMSASINVFERGIRPTFVSRRTLHTLGLKVQEVVGIHGLPRGGDDECRQIFHSFCQDYCRRHPEYVTGISPLRAIIHTISFQGGSKDDITSMTQAICLLFSLFGDEDQVLPAWVYEVAKLDSADEDKKLNHGLWLARLYPETCIDRIQDVVFYPSLEAKVHVAFHEDRISDACKDWCIIETCDGYLGQAPAGTLPGDIICILRGSCYPIVLRKTGDTYVHVGISFVEGFMHREARRFLDSGKAKTEMFAIC